MKTTLYVFSGTGTSLAVANQIAQKQKDTTVLSMVSLINNPNISTEAQSVGFIFPCYFGGLPQLVKEFVEKVDLDQNQYVFTIITAGGHPGYGFKFMKELLAKKEIKLSYSAYVSVSSNYMVGWYYDLIRAKNISSAVEGARVKIEKIVNDIGMMCQQHEKDNKLAYVLPQIISPKKYIIDTKPWDKEYSISCECNHCGICEKVCPVGNISNAVMTPTFAHNCQRCMACVQYCPKQAIIIDGVPMNKIAYTHPDITVNSLSAFNKG